MADITKDIPIDEVMADITKDIPIDEVISYFHRFDGETRDRYREILSGQFRRPDEHIPRLIVRYTKKINPNSSVKRLIQLVTEDDIVVGHFEISGQTVGDIDTEAPQFMTISTEESDINISGLGLSRLMMGVLIKQILQEVRVRYDRMIAIDVEASAGFWPATGMELSRYGIGIDILRKYIKERPRATGGGEYYITMQRLSLWSLHEIADNIVYDFSTRRSKGGRKIKKTKRQNLKKRKTKKRKTKKDIRFLS